MPILDPDWFKESDNAVEGFSNRLGAVLRHPATVDIKVDITFLVPGVHGHMRLGKHHRKSEGVVAKLDQYFTDDSQVSLSDNVLSALQIKPWLACFKITRKPNAGQDMETVHERNYNPFFRFCQ